MLNNLFCDEVIERTVDQIFADIEYGGASRRLISLIIKNAILEIIINHNKTMISKIEENKGI
jgi:hypothetical protein